MRQTRGNVHKLHPRIKPSTGAGLGKALIEAQVNNDSTTLTAALRNFTLEQILSSIWETTVWITAHGRVHGNIDNIDRLYANAFKRLGSTQTWAHEFLETIDEALQHDAEAIPVGNRRPSRRPMIGRPIFTTWLTVQPADGPFSGGRRPYVGFDGPRAAFTVTISETSTGMIEGAIDATAAVASTLAEEEGVPVTLLLSVVNAVTMMRGARGDYVG
jgi:hypothetical protein